MRPSQAFPTVAAAAVLSPVHSISATGTTRSRARSTSWPWTVLIEGVHRHLSDDRAGWRRPSLLPLGLVAVAAIIILAGGTIRILDAGESSRLASASGRGPSPSARKSNCSGGTTTPMRPKTRAVPVTPTPRWRSSVRFTACWSGRRRSDFDQCAWMHRLRGTYGARVRNTAALAGVLLVAQAGVGALTVMYDNRDWTVALHLCMATIWTSTSCTNTSRCERWRASRGACFPRRPPSLPGIVLEQMPSQHRCWCCLRLVHGCLQPRPVLSTTKPVPSGFPTVGLPAGVNCCRALTIQASLSRWCTALGRWWSVCCSSSAVRNSYRLPCRWGADVLVPRSGLYRRSVDGEPSGRCGLHRLRRRRWFRGLVAASSRLGSDRGRGRHLSDHDESPRLPIDHEGESE